MPVFKQISIHESPKKLIKYILNPDKNEDMKYATGIFCSEDTEQAYDEFKKLYELYSPQKGGFSQDIDTKSNERSPILLLHYIQSFKPGECDAEIAHKIGVQWAKRMFGNDRPVLVSTHDDREHIHNHFAVSVFDKYGNRITANKRMLRKCRDMSDKLALEYGLSVIDEPGYHPNQKYAEWLARKKGTSWKAKIADEIDRFIVDESIHSVDDLMDRMKEKGYEIKRQKYISIKPPHGKHFVRTFRLGDGYSFECLEYRIQHKEKEMSEAAVESYSGMQREYAFCLREIQLMVYRKTENYVHASYYNLVKMSGLMSFISENGLTSRQQFEDLVNTADEKYRQAEDRVRETEKKITFEEKLIADSDRFLELWNKEKLTPRESTELGRFQVLIDYRIYEDGELEKHREKLKKLKAEQEAAIQECEQLKADRKTAADNYGFYLEVIKTDFERIMERKRAEKERQQRDRELQERYDRMKYEEHYKNTAQRAVPGKEII